MTSTSMLSNRSLTDHVPRCCICRAKPIPPRGDPLYPVFPFFKLAGTTAASRAPWHS